MLLTIRAVIKQKMKKEKKKVQDNHFYNNLRFLMFYQVLLFSQVQRSAIITYKHDIYKLPHELPNDLRLRILGNYETSRKCLNSLEW